MSVPREPGPLSEGPGSAREHFVTLRLFTDDGIEGIGYAGFGSPLMRRALREAVDAVAHAALGHDPLGSEAMVAGLLARAGRGAPSGMDYRALAAVNVATWDIKGKALGQPVFRLLGGFRSRVPTYASGRLWRTYGLDDLAAAGPALVAQGFRAMKLRLGGESSAAREVARMRTMRDAVGEDVDIMLDVNQGWDVSQAIAIGRELAPMRPYWLEDPVHHQDYDGLARVADALDTPVAAGEYVYGLTPFWHMLQRQAVDIVMVDLMRVGGITQWMKAAHLAEASGLKVVSHLAPEVLAHTMAAVPNGLTLEHMPWAFPLFRDVPRVEEGHVVLPERPGLGLEFDDEAVERMAEA